MMTKNSNTNKKSSTMARVALGATAVLALTGQAFGVANDLLDAAKNSVGALAVGDCALVTCDLTTGACDTAGGPAGGNTAAVLADKAGLGRAPANWDDCVVAAGHYLQVKTTSAADGTGLKVQKSPANWYAPGGTVTSASADLNVLSTALLPYLAVANKIVNCPEHSTSSAGDNALDDCKVAAGYYLATSGSSGVAGTIKRVPDGSYLAAAVTAVTGSASTPLLCTATYTGVLAASVTSGSGNRALISHCVTKPGYEISTVYSGADATTTRTRAVLSGYYNPGGVALTSTSLYASTANCQGTYKLVGLATFTTTSGAETINHCVLQPGYSITATPSDAGVETALTAANKYNPGGSSLKNGVSAVGAGDVACPFAGTSPEGSSALSQCTPDCATTNTGSNAVALQGTCVCAANFVGSPVDKDAGSTGPATYGCVACPTGMVSAPGSQSCVYPAAAATPTAATPAAATPGAPGSPGAAAASSGASSVSVFAAVAAIAAAQFAF